MITISSHLGKQLAVPIVLMSLTLGGCSTTTTCPTPCVNEVIKQQQSLLETKEEEIALLTANLVKEQGVVARLEIESRQKGVGTGMTTTTSSSNALLPPSNAVPGECYARVLIPPKYETKSKSVLKQAAYTRQEIVRPAQYGWQDKRVLVKEAAKRIETIPAKYEWVNEQVLVKEASERVETIPAKYDLVNEQVLIKEASERIETIPAKYEWVNKQVVVQEQVTTVKTVPATYRTVTEKVLEKPAHSVWKKGNGLITKIDEQTGEIMCLVEVPATYKTISQKVLDKPETTRTVVISPAKYKSVRTRILKKPAYTRTIKIPAKHKTVRKRVLRTPAKTRKVTIPAEYKTVRKQLLKTPAKTRKVEVPAEYKTIRVKVQTTPAQTRKVQIPAKYETIKTQIKLSESKLDWQVVLCETNMTQENIKRLQVALRRAGFNPGRADGVIGKNTLQAVENYQRANKLPRGGITVETLEALNVKVVK
ncbi:MAG: hypothetical protein DRQ49_14255 [Gammaproteobacteria bacterium]|nr:MAG: hypothetical protein DRQ49_14255 [Gammaproteobacteria bacterium]RKZ39590.1 MAG: hypothetical protein DRQ41_10400 [Gammaproteobacteria bacterium]RKZ74021.1 MAG: hypothetical protein DRQ57_12530 [Gammaproteobacteria bacterium]